MTTNTKTYTVHMRESYAWDLKVSAASATEAIEKAEAFYAQQRKPASQYVVDGLTAELTANLVRCSRPTSSQLAWAKARANARDNHRDAAQAA